MPGSGFRAFLQILVANAQLKWACTGPVVNMWE